MSEVAFAKVPVIGDDGRLDDKYVPAGVTEGVASAQASATAAAGSAAQASVCASSAEASASRAEASEVAAQASAQSAQSAQDSAQASAASAQTSAQSAATSAADAARSADDVRDKFITSAQATTLDAGEQATASVSGGVLELGVPRGADGTTPVKGVDYWTPEDEAEVEAATTAATQAAASATEAASAANEAANEANAIIAQLPLPDGNVPRATKRGEVVSVDDAYAATPLGLKVYGRTRQNLWVNPSGTSNGVTVTSNEDGSITLSGSATSNVYIYAKTFALKPGTKYTLSVDSAFPASISIQPYSADGYISDICTIGSNGAMTAIGTIPSNQTYSILMIQNFPVGSEASGTYRIMLNEGPTAEPWCPPGLTSAEPTQVVVAGKNLYKNTAAATTVNGITFTPQSDGGILVDGTATATAYLNSGIKIDARPLRGKTLCMSGSTTGVRVAANMTDWSGSSRLFLNATSGSTPYAEVKSDDELIDSLFLSVQPGTTVSNSIVYPQLELGSTATAYEPPNVQTLTLDPVELRGLPDGTADVLDVRSGSVEKRTGKSVFDGSSDENWSYSNNQIGISNGAPDCQITAGENARCNTLQCRNLSGVDSGINAYAGGYVDLKNTSQITSTETGKSWLVSNPTTYIYPRTPTTSAITPVALPTLPSPVCNVWAVSDVPCEVEMEYVRDINVVLAKLEAAVASNALAIATN